ncbi:hypothetical protein RHSIM_Rhsim08G0004900 [Rhododendron simsii]|uniref:Sugar phosphate transporter domain-containing protein n=1 Tax=Rhododendron simsii TaxID=118357 RepID=A0A834LE32_RHOSS|nr:hypothetical protein RHSIM_Rhsim08G0004900 [Rhododendron simsii]
MTMPLSSKANSKVTLDAAAWAFNIVTSVGIIMVNKALMATYGFSFATTLTGLHFAATTLMTLVLRWMGHIQSSHLPPSEILKFIIFANFSIVGMNVSLMWNSVGFYQIAKLSMIPVSCFLEVVFDKMRYSRDTKLSILLVLLGVAICTVTDMSVNAKGFIAAFVAVWATALQQYYVHYLQRKYAIGSFNLLGHTAPAQAASLLLLGPFVDYCLTNKTVGAYPYTLTSVFFIILSCTIAIGFLFFGKDGLNLQVVLGMVIAIMGMIWYGNASSKPGGAETQNLSLPNPKPQKQNGLLESIELDEKYISSSSFSAFDRNPSSFDSLFTITMIMPPASKVDSKATLDAAAWAFNIITSVGIIIVNKALMATYGFRFATTLTGLHFATTTLMTVVLRWMGHIQSSHLPASEILKFVVFANFSIVGMNVSLMWNSVGFYQFSWEKKRYSRDTKLSILLVLLGVAICTVTDMSVNTKGFIAAFVAVWATALQQYYVHFLQKKYALGSFNLLGHTAPVQAASLLLLGPFVDYSLTNKMVGAYPYSATSVVSILGFYKARHSVSIYVHPA